MVVTEGDCAGEDFSEADLAGEDFTADIPAVVEADYERPRLHHYSKPPEVYEHILRRGDTVLDPFAGSGSSRTACGNLDMGLRWSGCDIDPAYAETSWKAGRCDAASDTFSHSSDLAGRRQPQDPHPPAAGQRSPVHCLRPQPAATAWG